LIDPVGHGEFDYPFNPSASPADGEFVYTEWHLEGDTTYQNLRLHSGPVLDGACYGGNDTPDNAAWSPDARRIAFEGSAYWPYGCDYIDDFSAPYIQVYDLAVGHATAALAPGRDPDWSPDGARIAYEAGSPDAGVWTMNANGSGRTQVTSGTDPSWSPDGSKILVSDSDGSDTEIYVVNRDGSGRVALTSNATADEQPIWSPDGTKIVFTHHTGIASQSHPDTELWLMNSDGSGQARIPLSVSWSQYPSWHGVFIGGIARPKAATPMYIPLVPAYASCGSPNRQHAPPLSFGSCAPPAQSSGQLTVGTPDANGKGANSTGSVRLTVINDNTGTPADEADVTINVSVTDVRKRTDLSDYTGELRVNALVRATDKLNGPSPTPSGQGAGTVVDVGFGPSVSCTATSDPAIGSTCALATTADALIPGLVVGLSRSNWEFGQMRVDDGGPDGDGDSSADNAPFLAQGVFVP